MFNNFFNKFRKTEEVKEEDKRLNENDLKGYLRKYVPIEDVSSGDEWERYGENLDNLEEEEEMEDPLELTSNSNEEEMDRAYKNFSDSLQEKDEEVTETVESGTTEEEIKRKLFLKYLDNKDGKNEDGFGSIKDIKLEDREEKISPRKEKKTIKGMSPLKKYSSFDDNRKYIRKNYVTKPDRKDNFKTMSDKKKERMAREKIAKILDSQQE